MRTHRPERAVSRTLLLALVAFLAGIIVMIGVGFLLVDIGRHKTETTQYPLKVVEIAENELDPAVWGRNFPRHYDSFMKTQVNYGRTHYGGSAQVSRIDEYPAAKRMWAGYAFAVEYNDERGHYYALIDQKETKRTKLFKQPGACLNCHASETPLLIEEMGWEAFNSTPYDQMRDKVHLGTSCHDCHDPDSMALRITRPAFRNAMAERGIDLSKATRQEMRTYVCAQCHVEYYFKGEHKLLTFPWKGGLSVDQIEAHYDEYGFADWTHAESGAQMIKAQHPDFELWSTGIHARSGVSCADCHMPHMRVGANKISEHWVRSPLESDEAMNEACGTCHSYGPEEMTARVKTIQDRTAALLRRTEEAAVAAIDAIAAASAVGVPAADLEEARKLHRRASLRWDFVFSENSTGFHSPQESARILADGIDYARQAQLSAETARLRAMGGQ